MSPIVRLPLGEEIRSQLRERILAGEYLPGQRLTEQHVAREMGTSQGPVREAFASLCQEGLLISLPHRGTFVASVSEAEARMAYALRARIEPYAVELALNQITTEVLEDLQAEIQRMREAARDGDFAAHNAADMRFHGRLYELAGTDILESVWASISATIRQFVILAAPYYVRDLSEAAEHHVALVELLAARDLEGLRIEVPDHLSNLWKRMRSASDADPTSAAGDAIPGGPR